MFFLNMAKFTKYKKKFMKIFFRYYLFLFFFSLMFSFSSCKTIFKQRTKKTDEKEIENKIDSKIEQVIQTAKSYLGTRYQYGGMSKKGTDCSGLMCMSYSAVDVKLPRSSNEQSNYGQSVELRDIQIGDLVFFGN